VDHLLLLFYSFGKLRCRLEFRVSKKIWGTDVSLHVVADRVFVGYLMAYCGLGRVAVWAPRQSWR